MKRKASFDCDRPDDDRVLDNNLARLPSTVVGKIIGSLPVADALSARGVCKPYSRCKPQWSTLKLKHPSTFKVAKIKKVAVASSIRKLVLQFSFNPKTYVDITGFTALHTLVLQHCEYRFFAKAVSSIANLKNLDLDRCLILSESFTLLTGLPLESLAIEPSQGVCDTGLSCIGKITTLKSLSLPSCDKCTDAGVAHLVQLENLEHLNFRYCSAITDKGALSISKLAKLSWLDIQLSSITAAGVAHLAQLKGLTHLNASMCTELAGASGCQVLGEITSLKHLNLGWGLEVYDQGMVHLQKLCELEYLDLSSCEKFDDAAAAFLGAFEKMQRLCLFQTSITDAGLVFVGLLQSLVSLDVACTSITDVGLVHVGQLSRLEVLSMHECQVSDAGLVHLFGIKTLLEVDARACLGVTQQGCDALFAAIANPNLEIVNKEFLF